MAFLFLVLVIVCGIAWRCYKYMISKTLSPKPQISTRHSGIPIRIVNDAESCTQGINELLSFNPSFVGFDCEWKANRIRGRKQRKIALIQIAHSNVILLIQIHLFSDNIPIELIAFLSNVDIIKCGVGINGDARKLEKDHNLTVHGCVDLNAIYRMQPHSIHSKQKEMISLENLCHLVLDQEMIYKHGIYHDFWENKRLDFHQIHYAADDALIAFKIMQSIIESDYPQSDIMEVCFGKIDTNLFSTKSKRKRKRIEMEKKKENNSSTKQKLTSTSPKQLIAVLLPNNELLSFVPLKMAKMFIRKQWATIPLESDPSTIQMTFVPDAINQGNDDLFKWVRGLTIISPCCVICGYTPNDDDDDDEKRDAVNQSELLWHSLIPSKFNVFPKHQRHPYQLLMCTSCEVNARQIRREYRKIMERDLWYKNNEDLKYIDTLWNTRNTAWNLKHKKRRHRYSVEEQNEFVQEVLAYCKEENAEEIVIRECDFNLELDIDWYYNWNDWTFIVIRDCISEVIAKRERMRHEHNRKRNRYLRTMLNSMKGVGKIGYAEMWRRNFMEKMQPKFINTKQETFEIAIDRSKVASK